MIISEGIVELWLVRAYDAGPAAAPCRAPGAAVSPRMPVLLTNRARHDANRNASAFTTLGRDRSHLPADQIFVFARELMLRHGNPDEPRAGCPWSWQARPTPNLGGTAGAAVRRGPSGFGPAVGVVRPARGTAAPPVAPGRTIASVRRRRRGDDRGRASGLDRPFAVAGYFGAARVTPLGAARGPSATGCGRW